MWFFDDLADWWDKQKHRTLEILDDWVTGSDSWFRIAVATATRTAMEIGGGFVDVLRFGDGIAQGNWRGIAQDGLRLLSLAGPLMKGARGISRFLVPNPRGGICAWVSATQALRQTGVKHFATIDDLARAAGKTPGSMTGVELETLLRQVGANVARPAMTPTTIAEVLELAKKTRDGVVSFGVRWHIPGIGTVGHRLYAFRDLLGRVFIVDRTGAVVKSLKDLAGKYTNIDQGVIKTVFVIKNGVIAQAAPVASTLAVEVRAAITATRDQADAKMEKIERRHRVSKAGAAKGTGPAVKGGGTAKPAGTNGTNPAAKATASKGKYHLVRQGETWRSIAAQYATPATAGMIAGAIQSLSEEQGLSEWMAILPTPGTTIFIPASIITK